jgi:chromosome segregation ATPase
MNQSLIALLVHQKISYKDALELASDPEDLSLKIRKLFPALEERVRQGGQMAPSYSDFSQITELMDIKRLYEEQESQFRQRMLEKEEEIDTLRHDLEYRNRMLSERTTTTQQKDEEIARIRADADRLRADAQAKVAQLQERIKELNQKLMAVSGPPGVPKK